MTPEEQAAADEIVKAEQDEEAAFSQSFSDGEETQTEVTPTPAEPEPSSSTPAVAETKEATPPKYVTDAQLAEVLSRFPAIEAAITKSRDDVGGRVGSMEALVRKLQAETPVGQAIVIKPEDLAETTGEYETLGPKLANDLTKIFSKFKGTKVEETDEAFAARVDKIVASRVTDVQNNVASQLTQVRHELLTDLHEDWQTVVGAKGSATAFRVWLKTEGPEFEQKILGSQRPGEIAKAITKFKEVEAKKQKDLAAADEARKVTERKEQNRTQRLAEAIPPKGGGSNLPPTADELSEEAAFTAAFKKKR